MKGRSAKTKPTAKGAADPTVCHKKTKAAIQAHKDSLEEQADLTRSVEQITLALKAWDCEGRKWPCALMQVMKLPQVSDDSRKLLQAYLNRDAGHTVDVVLDLLHGLHDALKAKLAEIQG